MIPLKLIDDKANDDINLSGIQTNSKMIKNGKVNLLMREQKIFLVRLMKVLRHILHDLGNYYPLFIDSSNL